MLRNTNCFINFSFLVCVCVCFSPPYSVFPFFFPTDIFSFFFSVANTLDGRQWRHYWPRILSFVFCGFVVRYNGFSVRFFFFFFFLNGNNALLSVYTSMGFGVPPFSSVVSGYTCDVGRYLKSKGKFVSKKTRPVECGERAGRSALIYWPFRCVSTPRAQLSTITCTAVSWV